MFYKIIYFLIFLFGSFNVFSMKIREFKRRREINSQLYTIFSNSTDAYKNSLMRAISEKDAIMLEYLLSKFGLVNFQDEKTKDTPLIRAVKVANLEIVELLVEYDADVNFKDNYGLNAFIYSVLNHNIEISVFLLNNDADVFLEDKFGKIILLEDLLKSDDKTIFDISDYILKLALIKLVSNKDLNLLKRIISKLPKDYLNYNNFRDETLLNLAIIENNGSESVEFAKLLLENGADINAKGGTGRTPLIYAVIKANINLVDFLLKNGAKNSINVKDKLGLSAFYYSMRDSVFSKDVMLDIMRLLAYNGAKLGLQVFESNLLK